jgi:hypothetical protein
MTLSIQSNQLSEDLQDFIGTLLSPRRIFT